MWAYVAIFGFVLGIIWFFLSRFKHEIIIKRITGKSKIVEIKKLRMVTNIDGTNDFYFMNNSKISRPPADAYELTTKGSFRFTAYFDGNQYHYVIDKTEVEGLPKFQPYSENQRTFQILQNNKADLEEGNWTKYVPMVAGGLAVIIILFMAYMTYENWNETAVQLNQQNVVISENNVKIMEMVTSIEENVKTIKNEIGGSSGSVPN